MYRIFVDHDYDIGCLGNGDSLSLCLICELKALVTVRVETKRNLETNLIDDIKCPGHVRPFQIPPKNLR